MNVNMKYYAEIFCWVFNSFETNILMEVNEIKQDLLQIAEIYALPIRKGD